MLVQDLREAWEPELVWELEPGPVAAVELEYESSTARIPEPEAAEASDDDGKSYKESRS